MSSTLKSDITDGETEAYFKFLQSVHAWMWGQTQLSLHIFFPAALFMTEWFKNMPFS